MAVAESYARYSFHDDEVPEMEEPVDTTPPIIYADLNSLVVRLRAFMETSGGEYAYGFEAGMQRAADMVDNLINEHFEDQKIG